MKELLEWFQKNKREFPWRIDRTPYKVWISEIMLQQTRASVVIPYFQRWLELFPDVKTLAAAPLESVIKAWEGLGYYSRARNLHAAAIEIVAKFHGEIPSSREDLESIRGLGPYTVGAILSFGFHQRAAAVDGNVTRVMARYFSIEEEVSKSEVKRKIQKRAEESLDLKEPWVSAEALIELGATLCTPKPRCEACPLQKGCLGHRKNIAEALPIKKEEKKTLELRRIVAIIAADGKILLRKGEAGKVMADLYEFPYFEMGMERWPQKKILETIQKELNLELDFVEKLPETKHTFTRYKAYLYPIRLEASSLLDVKNYCWVPIEHLARLPFSSGHRKILRVAFLEENMISLTPRI